MDARRRDASATTGSVFQLNYGLLEPKRLLAGITFDSFSREVIVEGTSGNDTVYVTNPSPGQILVALIGIDAQTFSASSISAVRFMAFSGDDFFQNATSIHSFAYGHWGNDTLIGGPGVDRFQGGLGEDVLIGGNGNDLLRGNAGDDFLDGQWGNDWIFGSTGNDQIRGGDGNDLLSGDEDNDTILGENGLDEIYGGPGNDILNGGAEADSIFGGDGNDRLLGMDGGDVLYGHDGADELLGGNGNDYIYGGPGNDYVSGGAGDDLVQGEDGDDILEGDDGNDLLVGNAGDDLMRGGPGDDLFLGQEGNNRMYGDDGNDTIYGFSGVDDVFGGNGDDEIHGADGNDWLRGENGNDRIWGDNGSDTIEGGNGNDLLFGGNDNDQLFGQGGIDQLFGEAGLDGLFGGIGGGDQLSGGENADRFSIWAGDTVLDFVPSLEGIVQFLDNTSAWSETEISVVDSGFRLLHENLGHARILQDSLDKDPVKYIKYASLNGSIAGNYLSGSGPVGNLVYRREIRVADWDEANSFSNSLIKFTMVHEIGHSWDSTLEIGNRLPGHTGLWTQFLAQSVWTNVNPNSSAYSLSGDGKWWHLNSAPFVRQYSKHNPAEDWSTVWEILYDPARAAERAVVQSKINIINQLLAAI